MSTPQTPGDEQRFTALFDDAYTDVLRFVRRRHGEDGAEDVVSDTFLTAWRRLDDLPTDHGNARAWLFGIARGTLANSRRGAHRRQALGIRLAAIEGSSAAPLDDSAALTIDLARAWRYLSATDQETLALAVLDGLTSAQAARVLSTTAVAFRLRLSRARRRLRRLVDEGPPALPRLAPAPTTDSTWEATS
ncbi:RNA polymerase sigma factor [Brachybacterium sp. FME24]|uniref:RNA polymerase sigma factor n=1 Tax=Brachybacterium sp. FME24 TaxID=2742605 RepID=UPI001866E278|nr:RNA polymerase sigma factor [Brachybacterium sp. FME24]